MSATTMKPIAGYEGHYSITNDGRVLSVPRVDNLGRRCGGLVVKHFVRKSGHCRVVLCRDGVVSGFFVHHLVAEAFIGPRPSVRHVVNHRDFNPQNNAVSNLEWLTQGDNVRYSTSAGRNNGLRGTRIACAKLDEQKVVLMRAEFAAGASVAAIARKYSVSPSAVRSAVQRRNWRHVA